MKTIFFTYLLPTSIAIIVFYGSYYSLLRRGSFFQLNRFFLLFALLFSFVLPFVHFESQVPIQQIRYTVISEQILQSNQNSITTSQKFEKSFDWGLFLKFIYIGGIVFMFIKLLIQFLRVLFLVVKYGVKKENGYSVIYMKNNLPHFSFFYLIFINQGKLSNGEAKSIILHEVAHIKQYHFIDLLILEIATAFQWFNPVIWLYKHSLKSIHEYLADQAVLKSGTEKVDYCRLLVEQTTGFHLESLTNSFYYPSLKNRILMMTKIKNNRKNVIKLCFALPVFALLTIMFACSDGIIKKVPVNEFTKQRWSDYTDNPYHPAVYTGDEKEIAKCFLSAIDFDNWRSIITDSTPFHIYLGISETGKVEEVGEGGRGNAIIQISNGDFDFKSQFKKMKGWKPATTKEGIPIKSFYAFEAGDILRNELRKRGLKIYTEEEYEEEIEKYPVIRGRAPVDQVPKYKNGNADIVAYFISKLNFDNWKSEITDKSVIQCSFLIDESGVVANSSNIEFINQGNYVDSDFNIDFSDMGNWTPAMRKGKPVMIVYRFDAGDALREALKSKGIKVYTGEEYLKLSEKENRK